MWYEEKNSEKEKKKQYAYTKKQRALKKWET